MTTEDVAADSNINLATEEALKTKKEVENIDEDEFEYDENLFQSPDNSQNKTILEISNVKANSSNANSGIKTVETNGKDDSLKDNVKYSTVELGDLKQMPVDSNKPMHIHINDGNDDNNGDGSDNDSNDELTRARDEWNNVPESKVVNTGKDNVKDSTVELDELKQIPVDSNKPIHIHINDGNDDNNSDDSDSDSNDGLTRACDEWNNVPEIKVVNTGSTNIATERITFNEALDNFQTINISEYADKIRTCITHTGISSFWHTLTGPPKLSKALLHERALLFTLAVVTFDNSNKTHIQLLQTIYRKLTNTKIDCPRYGTHWDIIGFQGTDPTTDLRGCGMLGLLTTLYFVTSKSTSKKATSVYQLSQDEIQNFPFCVMSINVTRITLQILREGKLNKECNNRWKDKSQRYRTEQVVFGVFLELYASIFHQIYYIWKTESKTMAESGFVIKDVEDHAKKKPIELMKNFQKILTNPKLVDEGKIESFVGIEDLDDT